MTPTPNAPRTVAASDREWLLAEAARETRIADELEYSTKIGDVFAIDQRTARHRATAARYERLAALTEGQRCDCGERLTQCTSCAVADYEAANGIFTQPTAAQVERAAQVLWGGGSTPSGYQQPWRERYAPFQHDGLLDVTARALTAALAAPAPVAAGGEEGR